MMSRVIAGRDSVREVEFIAVETPTLNETLRQAFVVLTDFWNGWTKHGETARHMRMISVFREDQPLGMLFSNRPRSDKAVRPVHLFRHLQPLAESTTA